MDSFRILAVILLSATPILAIIAAAVRFAGNSRILNMVDYAKVEDAPAMHAWVGRRMAVLPALSLVLGLLALLQAALALFLFGLFVIITLAFVVWLTLSVERFQKAH